MEIDRAKVKNFPEGARIQVIKDVPYVYFRYAWKNDEGKLKYSRDYLGTIEDNVFVPNEYYLRVRPTKDNRPEERWSVKSRKQKAAQIVNQKSPTDSTEIVAKSVGVTALAAGILHENGMVEDVKELFEGDVAKATKLLNIALGAAITAKPTYLSADEAKVQWFMGKGVCPTSPRASEIHWDAGKSLDLSARISKKRISRLKNQPMLALDGSRLDCNSPNILEAALGKKKDGTFGPQINFSLLVDAEQGIPVGYRWFSGVTQDISTLEDFTSLWNLYGLKDKDPMIVVDRGYYSQDALVKLGTQGYRFLAGAKTGYRLVKDIITQRNHEFYEATALLENADFYGVQEQKELKSAHGKIDVNVSVFRNPVEEMAATRRFLKQLAQFEVNWLKGKADLDDALLDFYENPKPGKPLVRNMQEISNECYTLGYFAFVSNARATLGQSLDIYRLRNEAEVVFKLMMSNLLRSTRVHSTQALEGLLFTTFVALSILTCLRHKMRANLNGLPVSSSYTISEVFARLKKIQLIQLPNGEQYLINVTKKDKDLVAALGFEGLFDDVKSALHPLTQNLD